MCGLSDRAMNGEPLSHCPQSDSQPNGLEKTLSLPEMNEPTGFEVCVKMANYLVEGTVGHGRELQTLCCPQKVSSELSMQDLANNNRRTLFSPRNTCHVCPEL